MKAKMTRWTREQDLKLITAVFRGLTSEGVEADLGLSRGQTQSHLANLGLSFRDARQARRDGMTPEQYLETSARYKKPEIVAPVQPELPLDGLDWVLDRLDAISSCCSNLTSYVLAMKARRDAA